MQKKNKVKGSGRKAGDIQVRVKLEGADSKAGKLQYPLPSLVAQIRNGSTMAERNEAAAHPKNYDHASTFDVSKAWLPHQQDARLGQPHSPHSHQRAEQNSNRTPDRTNGQSQDVLRADLENRREIDSFVEGPIVIEAHSGIKFPALNTRNKLPGKLSMGSDHKSSRASGQEAHNKDLRNTTETEIMKTNSSHRAAASGARNSKTSLLQSKAANAPSREQMSEAHQSSSAKKHGHGRQS